MKQYILKVENDHVQPILDDVGESVIIGEDETHKLIHYVNGDCAIFDGASLIGYGEEGLWIFKNIEEFTRLSFKDEEGNVIQHGFAGWELFLPQ